MSKCSIATTRASSWPIVSVLSTAASRVEGGDDRRDIRYIVHSPRLKRRSIVLNRAALRRLLTASHAAVKIEYIKRDLLRIAAEQSEYAYPRSAGRISEGD